MTDRVLVREMPGEPPEITAKFFVPLSRRVGSASQKLDDVRLAPRLFRVDL
jgi:hypothetical protein